MDKNLIGYVLNALEESEHQEIEEKLRQNPRVRSQVDSVRQALAPLAADADGPEPPKSLVLETLALVAEHVCTHLPPAPRPRVYQGEATPRRWFRRPDLLVAASVMILAGGLCLPALVRSWNDYHIQSCKNNLQRFGTSLQAYSDMHGGRFPQVLDVDGPRGVAGVFVPALLEAGTLDPAINVACPADRFQKPSEYTVADLEDMHRDGSGQFDQVIRNLAPGYAYSLGFEEGNHLSGLRRDMGDHVPLMADRPISSGSGNSGNHGGAGQNVLFTGGHVLWRTDRQFGEDRDIYLNQHNQVLAGLQRSDFVLGPSHASPVPRRSSR